MNPLKAIENEITKLTAKIESEYPELYKFLDESPMTMPSINHPNITVKVMEDYLESLKEILKNYIETHKNK